MARQIHRNTLWVLGALALCASAIRPGIAADPGPVLPAIGGPASITVGAYFPADSQLKNNGGNTQIMADLRYLLPVSNPLTTSARTEFTVGVEAGSTSGNHTTIIPITISEVVGMNGASPAAANSPYFGVGVGGYILNASGVATSGRVGGFLQAGYNFTGSLFLDAKYQWVENGDGAIVSGGYRF